MSLLLIGAGRMGSALLKGWLSAAQIHHRGRTQAVGGTAQAGQGEKDRAVGRAVPGRSDKTLGLCGGDQAAGAERRTPALADFAQAVR